jgi:predicted DNA-binding transcriptional regulator AlpA
MPATLHKSADERLCRLPEVLCTVSLSRDAWLDLVRTGAAPQPVKIGQATLWQASEIQRWIADRLDTANIQVQRSVIQARGKREPRTEALAERSALAAEDSARSSSKGAFWAKIAAIGTVLAALLGACPVVEKALTPAAAPRASAAQR